MGKIDKMHQSQLISIGASDCKWNCAVVCIKANDLIFNAHNKRRTHQTAIFPFFKRTALAKVFEYSSSYQIIIQNSIEREKKKQNARAMLAISFAISSRSPSYEKCITLYIHIARHVCIFNDLNNISHNSLYFVHFENVEKLASHLNTLKKYAHRFTFSLC